ncbi:MAG: hypothetical protein U1F53_17980 [Burkholderiaceae bacterium]
MNNTPRRPLCALGHPLVALALFGLAQGARAEDPLGDKCNPNLFAPPGQGAPWLPGLAPDIGGDAVSGKPLKPGQTRRTRGTDTLLSPELVGLTVYDQAQGFSFLAQGSTVSGSYEEAIVASDADGTCKQHTKLTLVSGCIAKLRFHQYQHPKKPIVADFRRDLPGQVPSAFASRSFDGLTFEFQLKEPVCAPKTTRWLLLNTSINRMTSVSALELITPDGIGSPLFSIHVPDPAP